MLWMQHFRLITKIRSTFTIVLRKIVLLDYDQAVPVVNRSPHLCAIADLHSVEEVALFPLDFALCSRVRRVFELKTLYTGAIINEYQWKH